MLGRLTWERDQEKDIGTVEELDATLSSLAEEAKVTRSIAVELFMDGETGMCIAVGDDISPVSFYSRRGGPLVVNARGRWGEPVVQGKEILFAFSYYGEYSEVLRQETVPIDVAREAMRIYFQTGKRPDNLIWESRSADEQRDNQLPSEGDK